MIFEGKHVLVTGGTGSLGEVIVKRMLSGRDGAPTRVTVFSRDEAKQHAMKLDFAAESRLRFRLGDVRSFDSIASVLRDADIVINAAALKQVPMCEYAPYEAMLTNIVGAENIVRAIEQLDLQVETVVGISTDKACKPVNTMGMTKALQERVFIHANLRCPKTRFVCVRYGNVLASRGSVIPLFLEQIAAGGPVTVTTPEMTRFLLTLDEAVDSVCAAIASAARGEVYIPRARAARIVDLASAMVGNRDIAIVFAGIRPGEKVHETLVSDEEVPRTTRRGAWLALAAMLPELRQSPNGEAALAEEYSSACNLIDEGAIVRLLTSASLMTEQIRSESPRRNGAATARLGGP